MRNRLQTLARQPFPQFTAGSVGGVGVGVEPAGPAGGSGGGPTGPSGPGEGGFGIGKLFGPPAARDRNTFWNNPLGANRYYPGHPAHPTWAHQPTNPFQNRLASLAGENYYPILQAARHGRLDIGPATSTPGTGEGPERATVALGTRQRQFPGITFTPGVAGAPAADAYGNVHGNSGLPTLQVLDRLRRLQQRGSAGA